MSTSLALACQLNSGSPIKSLPRRVRAILNKYNATMLLPGVSGVLRFGYQPGTYRESTGQTLAAADQQVGLVVDAAGTLGPELVAPINLLNTSVWDNSNTASVSANSWSVGSSGGPMLITTPNKTYSVSFPWSSTASGTFALYNGNNTAAPLVVQQTGTSGVVSCVFTATSTRAYFRIAAGATVTIGESVSVRELPGIHASQSTSGFQPVLRNSGGIQSWQFDGTDDRLSLSAVPFQMSDDHFVVLGLSSEDVYAERRPFFVRNGATMFGITFGGSGQNILAANWIDDAGLNCSVSSANAVHNNTNYAVSMRKAGNSKTLRRDGVQLGLNTVQLGTATLGAAVPFIGMENGVSRPFRGHIHGVIFGKGAITDAELLTLERFVASLQGRAL